MTEGDARHEQLQARVPETPRSQSRPALRSDLLPSKGLPRQYTPGRCSRVFSNSPWVPVRAGARVALPVPGTGSRAGRHRQQQTGDVADGEHRAGGALEADTQSSL